MTFKVDHILEVLLVTGVVLLDGHSSHYVLDTLKYAVEKQIII